MRRSVNSLIPLVGMMLLCTPRMTQAQSSQITRPADQRPRHNDQQLAQLGIQVYESKRLKLYTDIDPQIARTLPELIDQAYPAWEAYFGKLPPAKDGSRFQITGYLIGDSALFREAGLIPRDLPGFVNGRHRGQEFWMNNQTADYYRRHLLIHEATHCFMTILPNSNLPIWYLEGMAEWFGTHRIGSDGKIQFGVMPDQRDQFEGLGRITMIEIQIARGEFLPLQKVLELGANDFLKNESYAWSWALCQFLETHPRYHQDFRELGTYFSGRQFDRLFAANFLSRLPTLQVEWAVYAHQLQHGYDHSRAAFEPRKGVPVQNRTGFLIRADRGWQSRGLAVQQGHRYAITATGVFTLAQQPKPWICEPQGISFRYFQNRPLGMLLAAIQNSDDGQSYPFLISPIGTHFEFTAPSTGTLYFRVNDDWSQLEDNSGYVHVTIIPREGTSS